MKKAIVFGGGSKNGTVILESLLKHNYQIINVGSTEYNSLDVTNIKVDWNDIDLRFINKQFHNVDSVDFVFFNQNNSSLCVEDFDVSNKDILNKYKLLKDWNKSLWLSCQMPYMVLHTLGNQLNSNSKIGWMLSSYVDYAKESVHVHPDYSSYKFFNYMAMNCFAEKNNFSTFGIVPDFGKDNNKTRFKQILDEILSADFLDAQIFKF